MNNKPESPLPTAIAVTDSLELLSHPLNTNIPNQSQSDTLNHIGDCRCVVYRCPGHEFVVLHKCLAKTDIVHCIGLFIMIGVLPHSENQPTLSIKPCCILLEIFQRIL